MHPRRLPDTGLPLLARPRHASREPRGAWLLAGILAIGWAGAASATPATGAGARLSISGWVLDETSSPVAGARVELHEPVRSLADDVSRLASGAEPEPVATSRTDLDGRFRIEVPAPGPWRLRVLAPPRPERWFDLAPVVRPVVVELALRSATGPSSGSRGDLLLELRSGGRRVAGAVLLAGEPRRPVAITAGDGVCRLPAVAPREPLFVRSPDGWVMQVTVADPDGGGSEIELPPTRELTGRLVDAAGGRPPARGWVWPRGEPWNATEADGIGGFRLRIPAGGSPPRIEADIEADAVGFETASVVVEPQAGPVRIALRRATRLTGAVLDLEGRPLAEAHLRIAARPTVPPRAEASGAGRRTSGAAAGPRSPDAPPRLLGTTDPDGRFDLHLPGGGRYTVSIERPGYGTRRLPELVLAAGESQDLGAIRLAPLVELAGRVVTRSGAAVAGAAVESRGEAESSASAVAHSGEDGRFVLSALPMGTKVMLQASHPRFATRESGPIEVTRGAALEIVLEPGAVVRGRVEATDGRPLPGATVRARLDEGLPSGGDDDLRRQPREAEAHSDERGDFELTGLPAGSLTLEATAVGYRTARRIGVQVEPGAETPETLFTLAPAAGVRGRVLLPEGGPASGARVTAVLGDQQSAGDDVASTVADDDGAFELAGLPIGEALILAERDGYAAAGAAVDLRSGDQRIELTLRPGLTLAGQVTDGRGEPVSGALVEVAGAPPFPARSSGTSRPDGSFHLGGLIPGSHRLTVSARGFVRADLEVTIPAHDPPPVVVRLEAGCVLRGLFLGVDTAELQGAEVGAVADDGTVLTGSISRAGAYEIDGLRPGAWTVVGSLHGGARQARAPIEVAPGTASLEVDLELGSGVRLSGTVRLAGQPWAGARVQVLGPGAHAAAAVVDERGGFDITGLEPGQARLVVHDAARAVDYSQPIVLAADLDVAIELAAAPVAGLLRDAQGEPVEAGAIVLRPLDGAGGGELRRLTDAAGRFLFPWVVAGEYSVVGIAGDGRRTVPEPLHHEGSGPGEELVLALPPL